MAGKRGRPRKKKPVNNSTTVTNSSTPTASTIASVVAPSKAGTNYHMRNSFISEHTIFMYVPEKTLPPDTRNRFLQLCDAMVMSLGAETVNAMEVEEIAQLYRDVLQSDEICETINAAGFDRSDPDNRVLLDHYDKLNKQIEKRKENLNIRTKDRKEARNLSSAKTMLNLLDEVKDTDLENAMKSFAQTYQKALDEFQSVEDYMEPKLMDSLPE